MNTSLFSTDNIGGDMDTNKDLHIQGKRLLPSGLLDKNLEMSGNFENKNAFQWEAYQPLFTVQGGFLSRGGSRSSGEGLCPRGVSGPLLTDRHQ